MNIIRKIINIVLSVKAWFWKRSLIVKIILILIAVGSGWLMFSKVNNKSVQPQYQTATVEKGTLIATVAGSGAVASTNSLSITTQASGVVSKLYVKDGDKVKTGDPIAEIDLDLLGKQRNSQALASYQSTQNALATAQAGLFTAQSDMLTKWNTYMNLAQNSIYQNSDGSPNTAQRQLPQYMSTNDDWLASEAKYKIQQQAIIQAQTSLNSSWLSYQQTSPTIYAPISGTVDGLSLQQGTVIANNSSSTGSTTTTTSQSVANIKTQANTQITLNLTEIDIPKIALGDKATIILDAYSGKTYTGKVTSINTIGVTSSGVTTYPTVISLDTENKEILPNMSASASIIIQVKDNVLMVPSGAVQNQNGETVVRVLDNGKITYATVVTGISSDSQIEIISGLNEGQTVVTGVVTSSTGASSTSPFSAFGGGGFRGTGGQVRINRN